MMISCLYRESSHRVNERLNHFIASIDPPDTVPAQPRSRISVIPEILAMQSVESLGIARIIIVEVHKVTCFFEQVFHSLIFNRFKVHADKELVLK
jgi:hypothetical protein